MKAVIQRVKSATVVVRDGATQSISNGLVVLIGIGKTDSKETVGQFVRSIVNAKLFEGENGHFSHSVIEKDEEVLLVSQFTLYGEFDQNNLPVFADAAKPSLARELYKDMVKAFEEILGDKLKTGIFGAYMNITLENDGPVTIIM